MIIRDARRSDALDIAKIQVNTWKQAYKDIFPEEFLESRSYEEKVVANQKWLEDLQDTTRVFVAELDTKQIIGFAVGGLERDNNPDYKGELWGIYISKNYQRKGIGTKLFERVVKHLLDMNINSMLVWVLKDNPYRMFYEKLNGQMILEKKHNFHGFIRSLVAYGWLEINHLLDKL
ncbi:MAG: GNAT family N-acetyltransferase [Promethearchaeia archaeon]